MDEELATQPPSTRRVLAWIIDMGLLFFVVMHLEEYLLFSVRTTEITTYTAIGIGVLGYFLLKDAIRGKSLGKALTGIRVVRQNTGEAIGLLESMKRNGVVVFLLLLAGGLAQIARYIVGDDIAAYVGAVLIFGSLAIAYGGFRDEEGQTTCDQFAKTKVIKS